MVERETVSANRDSRQAILAAATAEFDSAGFAGARVQHIADTAGVNKQLIFYYHGSKLGLYRDVVRSSLADVDTATADQGGPQVTKRLRCQVAALYEALSSRPHLSRLLIGGSNADHATHALVDVTFSAIITRLVGIITDGQRLGYFRDDCDAETTARHAVSLILGHLTLGRATTSDLSKDSQAPDVPAGICRLLLRSLDW